MLTDGDGRPMPPVGSKVRFFYSGLGPGGFHVDVYEGFIARYNIDREDQLPTLTLAVGNKYHNYSGGKWVTRDKSVSTFLKHVHGLVVLEQSLGITDDGIKTSEGSDFSHFFLTEFLADLEIKCEDQTFHVHRVLLAAASPYFLAMFQNDMTEASSRRIGLREIKPKVLKAALEWIYKSNLDVKVFKDDPDFAGDLLAAAEMYQLEKLKKIVEDELCDSLQLENVLELIVMGDMHRAPKLKEKALKLIAEKKKDIENLDNWRMFVKSHPDLTVEIFKMV